MSWSQREVVVNLATARPEPGVGIVDSGRPVAVVHVASAPPPGCALGFGADGPLYPLTVQGQEFRVRCTPERNGVRFTNPAVAGAAVRLIVTFGDCADGIEGGQ